MREREIDIYHQKFTYQTGFFNVDAGVRSLSELSLAACIWALVASSLSFLSNHAHVGFEDAVAACVDKTNVLTGDVAVYDTLSLGMGECLFEELGVELVAGGLTNQSVQLVLDSNEDLANVSLGHTRSHCHLADGFVM